MLNIFKSREPLVMLVDDDYTLLEMYQEFLERMHCRTVKVFGGKDAVAMAEKHKPQLILMDIMMPGITGLQILEGLKSKSSTKNIPVMMITGEQRIVDLETAFKLGAADYFVKPIDRENFEKKVKALLAPAGYSFPGDK